jgi:hypothetical protein
MGHYLKKAAPWIVLIVLAFVLPASTVRMREGWLFHRQYSRLRLGTSAADHEKPSRRTKKASVHGLPPQSTQSKNQNSTIKWQALSLSKY